MVSKQLYQEVIMDHNKKPRNWGHLDDPSHQAEGVNPLCGDHIHLDLKVSDNQILDVAFEGDGCAICKSSSSMMTTNIKGKTVEEAEQLVSEFREMATGTLESSEPNHLGRLVVFEGVKDFPSRVKCAILPWHTLQAALHEQASVSTEGEEESLS